MNITNNFNLTIMRTRILSLLLALLAFNNVTFGQGELMTDEQSDLFYLSTKFCFNNIIDTAPIKPLSTIVEKNKLPINDSLYCFNENDKEVIVGILATRDKLDYISSNELSKNYMWVFVLSDFKEVCQKKGIELTFSFPCVKINVSPIRLAHLLGIRNTPKVLWLCTFKVKVQDLFRPAYETSVYKNIRKSTIYKFNISSKMGDADVEWLQKTWYNNGYPWTRLGYTFDCGYIYSTLYNTHKTSIDLKNAIGVSEFILRPSSKIEDVKIYRMAPIFY